MREGGIDEYIVGGHAFGIDPALLRIDLQYSAEGAHVESRTPVGLTVAKQIGGILRQSYAAPRGAKLLNESPSSMKLPIEL